GLILVGGFFENLMEGYREQFIHSQTGHLQINVRDYYKKGAAAPFDYLMTNAKGVAREIEALPHVEFTVPRLKFGGMASTDKTSVAVLAVGTDAHLEQQMGKTQGCNTNRPSTNIILGHDLDPNDPNGVLLGEGLAEALGVKVGDMITFITTR